MIIFLVENGFPVDHVVFSDTGSEMPDTYAFPAGHGQIPDKEEYPVYHSKH